MDLKKRLKAIEKLAGGDLGLDAECYVVWPERLKKLNRIDLEVLAFELSQIITNCYCIAHGGVSRCCVDAYSKLVMETLKK